jgi:ankyrin repeat protein
LLHCLQFRLTDSGISKKLHNKKSSEKGKQHARPLKLFTPGIYFTFLLKAYILYITKKRLWAINSRNPPSEAKKMFEGKCRILLCSLCLMTIVWAPLLAKSQEVSSQVSTAATRKAKKAKMSQEKLNGLNSALFEAIDNNYRDTVVHLLAKGAQVNAQDRAAMTPLMHAALRGEQQIAQLLLNRGAEVNTMDIFGVTALMQAAWAGHVHLVEMLIAHGANANLQSSEQTPRLRAAGVSALMGACINGNFAVVKYLLSQHVNVNQQDAQGQSALMYAAQQGNQQIASLLILKGAQLEMKDEFGRTALTIATIYNRYNIVCTLISAGANVCTLDIHQMTPIVYASALDRKAIYNILKVAMLQRCNCSQGENVAPVPQYQ